MTAIAQQLTAASAFHAAISHLAGGRVYPVRAPQGTAAPYVIFQQIGSDPGISRREAAGATHRLFQVACFAATYEAAVALRDAVIEALDSQTLANGDSPTLEDERDGDLDEAVNLHRADADFLV